MIKDKLIMIDLDSTIINSAEMIISLHNKLYPSKYIEFNENHSWQMRPMINSKEDLSDLFKLFDHEDFYKDVIVFPNAIEIINKLAENNRVVVCSKHSQSRKPITTKWIDKVMPKVEIRFVDNFEDKGKLFDKVDYYVEDRLDSCESMKDICNNVILYGEYEWNKYCEEYIRFVNWKDIKNYLEECEIY